MTNAIPSFNDLSFDRPSRESLAADYAAVATYLDADDWDGALAAFDDARRRFESWASLVHLQFSRHTTDERAKTDRDYADALAPVATGHEVTIKRRLLENRARLESSVGSYVAALWEADITTFDPRIAADLEKEAKLSGDYTALLASAKIEFDGKTLNLAGLVPYQQSLDRETRHLAEQARWAFFAQHGPALDALFSELVTLRTNMAKTLGFDSYTALGYRRMRRTDYGPNEVAAFRDRIATHVTPLVNALLERRALEAGWDGIKAWDEALIDPQGNPHPAGDHDLLLARAQAMFDAFDPDGDMGPFFAGMVRDGYLDLKNREGKAGGGFCTSFPTVGMPFIFANFNGTHNDIGVFTHEMGHAYQNWKSRGLKPIDVLWPTMDGAEIHSMGLEFLTWPQIDGLVEEGAGERYRRMHLIDSLSFLPYGACVDHFQHEIYAKPDMTPEERHQTWQRLEKRYLPWRDWGDLDYPAQGGRWQAQMHIYRAPFYYIDYTLALCCAMQLWLGSRVDPQGTLEIYKALCAAGGSRPFTALVAEAGLVSPFETDALAEVVHEAEQVLLG
ncbi:oligoendopeptidase F [Neoasaia chiangmaiensis NBRC 101099]|uniref:Peptidase M3 n=1 Tax=Neoasaia chiangmaiensis TaxID=320497 RepID=A0A1U9KSQ4_9PROT|nr:M3 family oligoendopeptidase [Neoasaia chiangmaiensis]AQS88792.1 peptidase M3 [Neoasaia chiangmaiensis]GBR40755.1 oligoendopeptidase F [Neoasaia chiangmaiensis NBRC 101099]GEN13753.1 M3 family oligoendopeptidase [Neoasaia chiangmaiensis]